MIFQPTECLSREQIEGYLKNDLDDDSRFSVENHLLDCPLCAEAVEGFSDHYNFNKDKDLEMIANDVQAKFSGLKRNPVLTLRTWNRIAATLLFALISTAVYFYWQAQKAESDFMVRLRSSNEILENVRGADAFAAESKHLEGIEYFRAAQYLESMLFFEQLLESEPEDDTAHFYSGLAALNLGETYKAIEYLTYARLNSDPYYEAATWNLILANLSLNNNDEAKALIADLLKIEGGFYSAKAEVLLKELEKK